MDFSLRQLQYFVSVADHGSFSAAAATFPISHSAVALAITDLERGLGVQLFHRQRARGVTTTDAGRALLPEARATIAAAGRLRAGAQSLTSEVSGEFAIGSSGPLTASILSRMLPRFVNRHRGISVRLQEGTSEQLQEDLHAGRSEIALMYGLGIDPRLERAELFRARPRVLLGADHPLANESSIRLRRLETEPMILIDHPSSREVYEEALAGLSIAPTIVHRTPNLDAIRALVAGGIGWSIVVQQIRPVSSVTGQKFVTVPIADEFPEVSVVLVTADRRPTRRTEAFLELGAEMFTPDQSELESWTGITG